MSPFSIIILLVNTAGLMLVTRRWAPLPLLVGACYITDNQMIELGPFHFTVIRLLLLAGIIRVIVRNEHIAGKINGLDRLIIAWSVMALVSSIFHKDPSAALIYRLGLVYDTSGIYFLLRIFFQSLDDVENISRLIAILLIPIALEMIYEKLTVDNLFYALGGGSGLGVITVRENHVRAQGPFAHAILAGTIGAVCLPLMIPLWRSHRKPALIGIVTCLVMVITSTSSGPILTLFAAIAALYMWKFRSRMRYVRWILVAGYIALDLIMNDPAYFIVARVDLTGGSTGWHRARLIQSSIEHLSEWWLGGTDFTRHWMPTGVSWSRDHTDITNHFIQMGVWGGLPLMLLFIAILYKGFSLVGQIVRKRPDLSQQSKFLFWALGASLFAHVTTFMSVSYFDQSFVFIYLTLAAVGSSKSWADRMLVRNTSIDHLM